MLMPMIAAAAQVTGTAAPPLFTRDERAAIVAYWNAPGRYSIGAPAAGPSGGPWQVRLTPEGSRWFWAYTRAVAGPGKPPPNLDIKAAAPDWEAWVQAKLVYDRALATLQADLANRGIDIDSPAAQTAALPPLPGPIPDALLARVGNPPAFAAAVVPRRYRILFDDGDLYAYTDNVPMRPRYAYYRCTSGVMDAGKPLRQMTDAELDPIFTGAGMSPSEARAAKAVSRLEGGFEAVNTYDTGWVSIGFIQCITAENGDGSLMDVLTEEKTDAPSAYQNDFRRFGIDVSQAGILTVVDPTTGAELSGNDAVRMVIEDKRLTACFQRAGRRSLAFRAAQVKTARKRYWPADDPFTAAAGQVVLKGSVKDIIRSEAGMATLFDRKVNRGSIAPFDEVVSGIVRDHRITTIAELQRYERAIIAALKYRVDFLTESSLSQPD